MEAELMDDIIETVAQQRARVRGLPGSSCFVGMCFVYPSVSVVRQFKNNIKQEYKRGVEDGLEVAEDASRLSAEASGQVKGAAEEALDGAVL